MAFATPGYRTELGESAFSLTTATREVALTVLTGEFIVLWLAAESAAGTLAFALEGGGLTFTPQETVNEEGRGFIKVWTATAAEAGTFTIKATRSGKDQFGTEAVHWGLDALGFTAGTFGQVKKAKSTGAPELSWETAQENVAAVVIDNDFAAKEGAHTWRTPEGATAITETVSLQQPGSYGLYGGVHSSLGAKGTKKVGLTAPGEETYTLLAIEVLGPEVVAPAFVPHRMLLGV